MKNGIITIGLDVGNSDTKTQTTSTVSGFSSYAIKPFAAEEYIMYNGKYYVTNGERFPYVKDKTVNENLFILSLFGIAKEILSYAEKKNAKKEEAAKEDAQKAANVLGVQGEINKIHTINLGVGLPPTHMSTLKESTIEYYKTHFGDGVEFSYQNYKFNLKLNYINCYPQDYAALISFDRKNPKNADHIIVKYTSYYAIDIGGWTVDIISIVNGKPNMNKCDSKSLGVLAMYDTIVNTVEMQTGFRLTNEDIEMVLMGKPTILDEQYINLINNLKDDWFDKIVNVLTQFGLQFEARPVVFLGGGAQLFKSCIKKSNIKKYDIIPGANSNAKAYRALAANGL